MGLIFKNTKYKGKILNAFLLFTLLTLIPNVTGAQEAKFGVKGGLNYSSIVGDLTNGMKFRLSGHGGVYLEVDFSNKFSFRPELLYSSQGFQFSTDLSSIQNQGSSGNENDYRTNVQLNFLTVPILGKFEVGESYWLEFGPQFGFLLNQVTKIKNLDELDGANATSKSKISGDYQLDYGVAVGVGFVLSDQLSISPRFYVGLRNRLNGIEGNLQNYNASIQLSVNYLFL
ncbi:PorT family protein [Aurantibacter crassamenti]|uniref:porin family protein n=1 Tax=Aurantibacter crassamenti TaxID=1837375 RepID=UPI00193A59BD|nr:porin family protein [Aurantibacter crassamenti]MBM1105339.1 PorT family protein [Aurantibacter crassamenti]